jgi:carboxypeptidase Q
MRKNTPIAVLLALAFPFALHAQTEKVDAAMMQKIRTEGLEHSKVMEIAFNLTDKSGNRLTASPGFMRAANYAEQTLAGWGLQNVKLDPWGEFGKGWELEKSYVAITAPYYKALAASPKAWTAGTKSAKNAEVIVLKLTDSASLEAYRGQLKGKVIMLDQMVTYKPSFRADAHRWDAQQLDSMANAKQAPARQAPNPNDTAAVRRFREQFANRGGGNQRVAALLREMAKAEGAVAILSSGSVRSHDGTIFAQGGGAYKGNRS